jgi:hypothetical protein
MVRYVDPLIFTNTFIDANILDEINDGEGEAVRQIIKLFHDRESPYYCLIQCRKKLAIQTPRYM